MRPHVRLGGHRLAASAFVHDAAHTLTVVLANPLPQPVDVTLRLGAGRTRELRAFRTSASERFAQLESVAVREGQIALTLPGESMLTLHGEQPH